MSFLKKTIFEIKKILMEQFELHNSVIDGGEYDYPQLLYSTPAFLKANNHLPQKHFYFFNKSSNKYLAHLAASVDGDIAVSPLKAPFGGVEFEESLSAADLKNFIKAVENTLASDGVQEIRLHQPPENYQLQDTINDVLLELEYDIIQERDYHGIDIDGLPLSEKMVDMQKRRLKKCEKAGFIYKKYRKSELAGAFHQIDRWRTAADKRLSMTWADLHNSSKRNPKAYHAFGIENEHGLMIAGSIVVKVSDRVLYNFFPASYDAYNAYSPMVMLTNKIYEWGQDNGFVHLDLGTSYVHKNVNTGLRLFKERLGGKVYRAWSWRKKIS